MAAFTELEMIKGCRVHNRTVQKYLYEQYCADFLKVCLRYAKDFHDAEQLLQDGFVKIFNSIKSYQFKGSFEGWMRRIIVNTCLDYLKSKRMKEQEQTKYFMEIPDLENCQCRAEALEKMAFDNLIEIIQSLSPMSRAVFNLFILEGYGHKEIAAMLQISEGTSQWHLNNARKVLQRKIENAKTMAIEKVRNHE